MDECVDSLGHVEIRKGEVLEVLKSIKVDKSPGSDGETRIDCW